MLEMISGGFKKAQDLLQGKTVIQEKHIDEAIKEIRISLLEADVEFHVVKTFIDSVKEKAVGEIVQTRVSHGGKKLKASPQQHFVKICYDELVELMGPVDTSIVYGSRPVSAIMMVGLMLWAVPDALKARRLEHVSVGIVLVCVVYLCCVTVVERRRRKHQEQSSTTSSTPTQ